MNRSIRLAEAARNAKNPWPVRVVCGLAVAYILFPLDFLPDVMPVIGWLDDLLVLVSMIGFVWNRRRNLPVAK